MSLYREALNEREEEEENIKVYIYKHIYMQTYLCVGMQWNL